MSLSAFVPVHAGVDPRHFRRALDSVVDQTRRPDEVVVVEDGPLGPPLTAVLDRFADQHPGLVRRVAFPVNRGPGAAAAAGMEAARGDVVARLDSDDVALPHRFETQLRYLDRTGSDVVSASMLEFEGEESNVVGIRRLPESHDEILRYARTRSPINQPAVMMRRASVLAAGNYVDIGLVEDYDLWARMLARGARMSNVPEPLVLFRCTPGMYARRGGLRHLRAEWELQRRLLGYGLVGPVRRWSNLVIRIGFRLLPSRLLRRVYALVFRKPHPPAAAGFSVTP